VTHACYLRRLRLELEDGNNTELLHQAKGVPLLPLPQPFFRLPCGKWKCHVALPPFVSLGGVRKGSKYGPIELASFVPEFSHLGHMVNTITKQIGNNIDDRGVVVIQPVKE